MADSIIAAPKPRRWHRVLTWGSLSLLAFVIVLYFVGTSSAFFKGFILPRLSRSLNASITVADASISPFSTVILHQVKVQTTGAEPLLIADEIRAVYHLREILGGNYHVEELTLNNPVLQIITNADGSTNLDPLLKSSSKSPKAASPAKPAAPPQIDIKKISLNHATIRLVDNQKGGARSVVELSGVNIALSDLKNGQTGKLTLDANLQLDSHPAAPGTNATLQAKATASFSLGLTADLKPSAITGNTRLEIVKADGALADLASLTANLDCDITPAAIKQVALKFQKSGHNLGELRVSGPFDLSKSEGHLALEIAAIDHQVLNLLAARSGLDFGGTTINSTNQIDLAKGGANITVIGGLRVIDLALTRGALTSPVLSLRSDYNVTVDRSQNSLLLRALALDGTQNQQPFLHTELTSPLNIPLSGASPLTSDAALKLAVTGLDLAQWKPLLGDTISGGLVNLSASLNSQKGGTNLTFELISSVDGLAAQTGTNRVDQMKVSLRVRGTAADLDRLNLADFQAEVSRQAQSLLTVGGSGQYEVKSQKADLQVALDASLPRLLQLFPQPNLNATAGTIQLKSHVVGLGASRTITGSLALTNLTGQFAQYQLAAFGFAADLELALDGSQLQIRKLAGALTEAANPGGKFELTGDFNLDKKAGGAALKITDVNENTLRPFLAAALGDKKLVSVSINATSSAHYDPMGETSIKADFKVANLLATDPKQQLPATPLEVGFQVDASLLKQVADIRQFQISLTPTKLATNQLSLSGKLDLSQTNYQGNLKLAAPSLDLTPWYNLFADKPTAKPGAPVAAAVAKPVAATPETEPAAHVLPFRNSSLEVNIGRLYLRNIAVTNLQTTAKFDGSHILLKPFALNVNGGPVTATVDLNLGVPGYQYDVTLSADKIPIEPLLSSFSTNHTVATSGNIVANTQIKGAGITGTSLQKSLAGQVTVVFTNANIQLESASWFRWLVTPIAFVLGVNDIDKSPLKDIEVNAKVGGGVIEVTQARIVSDALIAESRGQIPIADDFLQSPLKGLPVDVSLSRSLAQKARLMPSNTPADAAYVKLPTFTHITGTLGDIKAQTDKLVITTLIAESALKIPGAVGGKAGDLIKGVGSFLTGQSGANTNSPAGTNAPATNSPLNPFDLFRKVIPK